MIDRASDPPNSLRLAALLREHERVGTAAALPLIGKGQRVVQQMCEAGEIPGVVKIRGRWTFNLLELIGWLKNLEEQQRATRKAAAGAKPRPTPNGTATRSPAGRGSTEAGGRYERAMSKLYALGSRKKSSG